MNRLLQRKKHQLARHLLLSVLLAGHVSVTRAQDNAALDTDTKESESRDSAGGGKTGIVMPEVLNNVNTLADSAHRATSDSFNRFVLSVDDFFGDAESEDETNRSWGHLRFDRVKSADENAELKVRLKLRVVLPRTERRLRLLVSTEESDADGTPNQTGLDAETEDQNIALALRFVRSFTDQVKVKFDVGSRTRDRKVQIFGRISASNTIKLARGWTQRISNNFYLYSSSGYQNRFRLSFQRPFTGQPNVLFRSTTSIEGTEGTSGASINETIGFYVNVSERTALAFEGLYDFVTSEDDELDTHYLGSEYRIRFRQTVWRPWFYYELWPTVSFPASTDYRQEYGGLVRAEFLFGQF